jgi:peptidoglycan/LPS O-acetylase OafA/YrhL
MCHLFVFWVITQFCRFVLNIKTYQDGDLHSRLELSTFQANIIILASYVLTIVLAHFTYGYVEKKFYKN